MKKFLLLAAMALFIFTGTTNAQLFSDDFQDESMDDWTTVAPNYQTNPYTWHIADYQGAFYMSVAAFDGTNHATEQWVISPAFNASGTTGLDITFDNRGRYAPLQNLEVYVSTDFAGDSASFDAATWTPVTGFTWDTNYDDYDWVLATTSSITMAGSADTYLAFKYVSEDGGDGSGGNWTIDNVNVDGSTSVGSIASTTRIYPNPIQNTLNIKSEEQLSSVQVLNVIGQRIMSIEANSTFVNVNTEALNSGVYFVRVTDVNGAESVTKIIKK